MAAEDSDRSEERLDLETQDPSSFNQRVTVVSIELPAEKSGGPPRSMAGCGETQRRKILKYIREEARHSDGRRSCIGVSQKTGKLKKVSRQALSICRKARRRRCRRFATDRVTRAGSRRYGDQKSCLSRRSGLTPQRSTRTLCSRRSRRLQRRSSSSGDNPTVADPRTADRCTIERRRRSDVDRLEWTNGKLRARGRCIRARPSRQVEVTVRPRLPPRARNAFLPGVGWWGGGGGGDRGFLAIEVESEADRHKDPEAAASLTIAEADIIVSEDADSKRRRTSRSFRDLAHAIRRSGRRNLARLWNAGWIDHQHQVGKRDGWSVPTLILPPASPARSSILAGMVVVEAPSSQF